MRAQTWQDAYDAQMGLWRWYRTPGGQAFLQAGYKVATTFPPGMESDPDALRMMIAGLYAAEEQKVLTADPIFVSAEMGEVIEAAAEGFKPEPLFATDLLTHTGFVWYERPFLIRDRFDEPLNLRGWSWCRVAPESSREAESREDGTTVMFQHEPGHEPDFVHGLAMTIYADWDNRSEAPLGFAPIHVTPWWFGMSFDGNEVDASGAATGAAWWWRIAQVTLRLMQQRIAVTHNERASRPQRREALRAGFVDREVRVVRLRRERGEQHEPTGAEANYSHRFIVGGHWRNQWYPSGKVHRQIWISPYVKGPDDKPLVVKPRRAFTFDR
jgi:hypothetical protein